uniref:Fibronectin type III domain-containing protein n=1 Tax=Panagrellus redivivus TaxID=6233 RepID=A0A7E4UZS3_PANRE
MRSRWRISALILIGLLGFVFAEVPSAPRDLEVNQVNASTVKLTWERPESENGELLGYYVFKEKLLNGEPVDDHIHHEFVIADPAKLYAYVTGLEPNTEYAFRVCAFNPHGDGERTPAKKMMTGGMPPTPPRPQSVTMLSDDAPLRARIDWQVPENTYGQPINGYAVYYRPVDKLGEQDGFERLEVPGSQHFAELTKLFMGREYEIHISAGTEDGWSANATEHLITPVGVPDGEPLNVRYDIVSGQMTLQWDPPAPDRRNGNITYYRAILTPLDGASKRIDRNITTGRSSTYRVSAKHGYTFKVAAATMKGEGPFSPVLNVSPYDSVLLFASLLFKDSI